MTNQAESHSFVPSSATCAFGVAASGSYRETVTWARHRLLPPRSCEPANAKNAVSTCTVPREA